jgi:CheY-like chemotaxis protein
MGNYTLTAPTTSPESAAAMVSRGRPRVLVCDDSDAVRELLGQLLGAEFDCRLVASGAEALACVHEFAPDVIVTDLLMPGMDGYQLVRLLRSQPALAGIPVVMLTCVSDAESRAQGLELGADDYLVKPIRRRELLARVNSLLRLRRAMDDLEERSRALEDSNRTLAATQQSLVRAEKLAAVGTLVAGLAHEINGPLACLKSGAASAAASLAELHSALERALAAAPKARREALGAPAGRRWPRRSPSSRRWPTARPGSSASPGTCVPSPRRRRRRRRKWTSTPRWNAPGPPPGRTAVRAWPSRAAGTPWFAR